MLERAPICNFLQSHHFLCYSHLLLFIFVQAYCIIKGPKLNFPPSSKLPIIGILHQLSTQLHRSLQGRSEKYGPLILHHLGSSPTLIVSSAEIAKEIMKSHDSVFQNRPRLKAADVLFCGCTDVAFCPYGKKKLQRWLNGGEVDLGEMPTTMSNNIGSRFALGRKYEGENGDESFGALSKKAMELMGTFNFRDSIPYLKFMNVVTGFDAKLKKSARAFHALLCQVIDEHQKSNNYDHQQSDKRDLVDILLHLQKGGELGIYLTRESLIAILLNRFWS
ncbi:cytochrome P450 71A1-like [Ziziphus jujuba]|uniref:Cytochrome P450 71A1-like n=1 Tax=Ziziphus jujuba TaxID=326968 RepID=A0ABM3ZWM9_ZIZJJ|nr:cytochrome P450 71A1-like [Ziziphus jujuba]